MVHVVSDVTEKVACSLKGHHFVEVHVIPSEKVSIEANGFYPDP